MVGRPQLPHGTLLYPKVTAARAALDAVRVRAEAEAARIKAELTAAAQAELIAAVRQAYAQGASISKLCEAYGTSARITIYNMLDPSDRATTSIPTTPKATDVVASLADWKAVVSVDGSRVSAREVPPKWWTFERGMDRPREPYSGWIDVADYGVVGSSDYPSPLQAEWLYGDGTLREAVDL